jgi:hypothetical protein
MIPITRYGHQSSEQGQIGPQPGTALARRARTGRSFIFSADFFFSQHLNRNASPDEVRL